MKKLFFFCVIAIAFIVMNSCSKEDEDNDFKSYLVGTWVMDGYYKGEDTHTIWFTYEEDGISATTVTLRGNGNCSGNGIVINGEGSYSVTTGNKWDDGYWAIIKFSQNGKNIGTVTLTSFDNDYLTGYVRIDGFDSKEFIFKKK